MSIFIWVPSTSTEISWDGFHFRCNQDQNPCFVHRRHFPSVTVPRISCQVQCNMKHIFILKKLLVVLFVIFIYLFNVFSYELNCACLSSDLDIGSCCGALSLLFWAQLRRLYGQMKYSENLFQTDLKCNIFWDGEWKKNKYTAFAMRRKNIIPSPSEGRCFETVETGLILISNFQVISCSIWIALLPLQTDKI